MTMSLPHDLGDGLILRHATVADAEALATFQGENQAGSDHPERQAVPAAFARDLLTKPHPTFIPSDFLIVEERHSNRIVSAMCLISQTWTYDGIPFGVGRPELVATAPDFRRRGLVRKQFDLIHAWSAERGELVQAITGIPNFYRQYSYEMTVNLGGGRMAYRADLPEPKAGEPDRYRVRPATHEDIPFLAETYRLAAPRYLLASVRDQALWRHDLFERSETSGAARSIRIVETIDGNAVGYLVFEPRLEDQRELILRQFEVIAGVSWLEVTPVIVRYLRELGKSLAKREGQADFERLYFAFTADHPVLKIVEHFIGKTHPGYAWYLRVPDVPAFLRVIAPALEARLADSVAVGYTGSLKISRYVDGFQLRFERGCLVDVTAFRPAVEEYEIASFPGLTFLHLLFGHRSIAELRYMFTDCQVNPGEYRVVLDVLFPKKASNVWPVE